jgi:hypothetical protein
MPRGAMEQAGSVREIGAQFYRDEYALAPGADDGPPGSCRANFVRGAAGRVAWLSYGGRLYARQG